MLLVNSTFLYVCILHITIIIHVGTHVEWLIQYEIYLIIWEKNQYLIAINICNNFTFTTIEMLYISTKQFCMQFHIYHSPNISIFQRYMIPYAIFTKILQQSKLPNFLSCVLLHQNCELQHNKHKSGGVGKPVKQLSYWVTCKLPTYLPTYNNKNCRATPMCCLWRLNSTNCTFQVSTAFYMQFWGYWSNCTVSICNFGSLLKQQHSVFRKVFKHLWFWWSWWFGNVDLVT